MKKTYKEAQIGPIALEIVKKIENGGVVALYGDLGTGKTTLTKAIAEKLGIENFKIKSPTYTYIRRYPNNNIYHIDLYRIDSLDELLLLEIEEIMEDHKNIVIIEWADKLEEYLPKKRLNVKLEFVDSETREITMDSDLR